MDVLLSGELINTPQATVVKDVEETIKICTYHQRIISVLFLISETTSNEAGYEAWQQFVNEDQQNV